MDRREVLKSVAAIPLITQLSSNGKVSTATNLIPAGHYLLFYDAAVVDLSVLAESPIAEGVTFTCVGLKLRRDQTIDDAIRLYNV